MEPRQPFSGLPNPDGSPSSRSFGTLSVRAQGNQKRKEYHVLRVLGAGTKACVKLAKHLKTGEMVAIKSIRKPAPAHNGGRRESIQKGFQGISLGQNGGSAVLASREDSAQLASRDLDVASSPTSVPRVTSGNSGGSRGPEAPEDYAIAEKEWRTECSIMARVGNHENLPQLIDYFETTGKWYLVMEYQRGGDLLSRLLHIEHYSERHAASIMATVCNAVHYLHSHGIAHRDLKPANLLMKDESENSNLCLIDFNAGFIVQEPSIGAVNQAAALLGNHANFLVSKQSMQTVTGTPFYLAPEIVLGKQYSTSVDSWSLGCIAFQLLTGVTPFQASASYEQLYAKILSADYTFPGEIPLSDMARDFVKSLLVPDPERRATASQALEHPWIQSLVPQGYLMLLQQFNHEADPSMFPPPSRFESPKAGTSHGLPPNGSPPSPLHRSVSADLRLKIAAGALPPAPVPEPTELSPAAVLPRRPSGWLMPQLGYHADPADLEFGQTLRSRWELMGRPGILQIPTVEPFFEHEELFGFDVNGEPRGQLSASTARRPSVRFEVPTIEVALRGATPENHVVDPALLSPGTDGDMADLGPRLKRGMSQLLNADRAFSGVLPGAKFGGIERFPSGHIGRAPSGVHRAASGVQVWCSPSGTLYLSEVERAQLQDELMDASDEEPDPAAVQAAMDLMDFRVSPDLGTTGVEISPEGAHVAAFPMLDLLRAKAGTSTPLWEWETTADYFAGPK